MGNVIQASELSGRKYSFTIAGDEPTTDEQRQIDSIIWRITHRRGFWIF